MASTFSTNLRLELQAKDENSETWGDRANSSVFQLLEDALSAETTVSTTGGTTVLTSINGASDQARAVFLDVAGALISNAEIEAPATGKLYLIRNGTSGTFSLTLKNSGGTGITIPQSSTALVFLDGSVAIKIGQESYTVTDFAKTLLDDATAVDMLATLGLSTYADQSLANTFVDPQTFESTSAGAAEGPGINMNRFSGSPMSEDIGGVHRYKGKNTADETITYIKYGLEIDDPQDSSEDGHWFLDSHAAGVNDRRWNLGEAFWSKNATGGDQGIGTINIEGDYYKNGSALPFTASSGDVLWTGPSAGSSHQFTHGLSVAPTMWKILLKCTSSNNGFSVDDLLDVTSMSHVYREDIEGGPTHSWGVISWADATTVDVRIGSDGIQLMRSPGGNNFTKLTLSQWDMVMRAWA